jgi:xylulokinase
LRAAQEGIVFSLNYGFEVVKSLGGNCTVIRAAKGNLFLSDVFVQAFANTTNVVVELFDTNGAQGAARAAAVGYGYYPSPAAAFNNLQRLALVEPQQVIVNQYQDAYQAWATYLSQ